MVFGVLAVLAACGGTSAPSATNSTGPTASADTTTPVGAVDPNAPEVVEPGDIPDDQAFVTYDVPGGGFSVDVPEGWARSESNSAVVFTDKFNTIEIASSPADSPPTVESVTSGGLSDVSDDPTFALLSVEPVTRAAGDGIVAKYEIGSEPNAVTGKKALLAVERFVFSHNGTEAVLTLSGAEGADNVDPWRIVSDSLTWA